MVDSYIIPKEEFDPKAATIVCNGSDGVKVTISYDAFNGLCNSFYCDLLALASADKYSTDENVINLNAVQVLTTEKALRQFGIGSCSGTALCYYDEKTKTFDKIQFICGSRFENFAISYDYANREVVKYGKINGREFFFEEEMVDYWLISPERIRYTNPNDIW